MSNTVETFEHAGYTIKIELDLSDHESPRDWECNVGTMVCWHNRYNLGDSQPKKSPQEYLEDLQADYEKDSLIILPLYLYDHSGITMNTSGFSCPWDSSQVGYIYTTKENAIKQIGKDLTIQEIENILKSEVEVYDQFLRGEVYGYVIEDINGSHVDSCWGFYDLEDCKSEAKSMADHLKTEAIKRDKLGRDCLRHLAGS